MATGYCAGCECGDNKAIAAPSFNPACETLNKGGIGQLIIACDSDINAIPKQFFIDDGNGEQINIGVDLSDPNASVQNFLTLLDLLANNNVEITEPTVGDDPHYHVWCVDADMPQSEDEVLEATNCRTKRIVNRTQKIVGEIDDTNDQNYLMAQSYQCGAKIRLWFITPAGHIYGGNNGIVVGINQLGLTIPRSVDELQKIFFEFEWKCLTQPPRFNIKELSIPLQLANA